MTAKNRVDLITQEAANFKLNHEHEDEALQLSEKFVKSYENVVEASV